ncbi:hypothetical protein AGMMS49940_17800 [Spirochaetia bacterium]|nr:hypothetical protein AGMMS49940_17800 [Spirochaetia bacterium]
MTGGLYLLDVFFKSSGEDKPWIGVVFGIVFGGGFLFLLIRSILKNRKSAPGASRLSGLALYKIAKTYGLDRSQSKALADVFREDADRASEEDPLEVIKDPALLDDQFRRAYQRIGDSAVDEAAAQRQISLLFSARNAIDAVQNTTGTAERANQIHRRFRRRQISLSCSLAMVTVREVKENHKRVRKMSLDGRRFNGDIVDISIGGCSVQSAAAIEPGARAKIEFSSAGSPRAALGQVLRVNRTGAYGTFHMKFITIPTGALNVINALVFEYGRA